MTISYRKTYLIGLFFLLLLITFIGSVPCFTGLEFFKTSKITSLELSELIEIIKIKDGFDGIRENFDKFIKGEEKDIQSIVDELLGKDKCPSNGSSAAQTSWVMDEILKDWRKQNNIKFL